MTRYATADRESIGLMGLQPVSRDVNGLLVCVDPRMELLSAVQSLGMYDSRYGLLTAFQFAYKDSIHEFFSPYADHPVVHRFDEMSGGMSGDFPPFFFGAPPEVLLNVLPDFAIRETLLKNEFLIGRAGGADSLFAFVDLLESFFHESNFTEFYRTHLGVYEQIVDETAAKVSGKGFVSELEAYYGASNAGYCITLVPLFHTGGFGPSVEVEDGKRAIYSLLGPRCVSEGVPDFGSGEYFSGLLRHEFSHSFVNPLTLKYRDLVASRVHLLPLVAEGQVKGCYGDWEDAVNEYTIRAVTTRLAFADSAADGLVALEFERSKGIVHIEKLMRALGEYEMNRDVYPSFESFFPELMKAFDSFAE